MKLGIRSKYCEISQLILLKKIINVSGIGWDLIALKTEVDKLGIKNLVSVTSVLNHSKMETDNLDVDKLKTYCGLKSNTWCSQ